MSIWEPGAFDVTPLDHVPPMPTNMAPVAPLQLSFADAYPDLSFPDLPKTATIQDRFAAFHEANPQVFVALRDMALDLVRRGHGRIGIGMLYETLRYSALRTSGKDYKLNHDFRSRYARLLVDTVPELAGCIELRRLRSL